MDVVDLQVAQQAIQRGFAVECEHQVVFGFGDGARFGNRLTALRDARQHALVFSKRDARQAALEHAVGNVQAARAAGRQAAKQVAAARALTHLLHQFAEIYGLRIGVHLRAGGFEVTERCRT